MQFIGSIHPLQRIHLKELSNDNNRRSLCRSPDHLVRRRHAKLGITQLKLLDGIVFRTAFLYHNLQAVPGKRPMHVRIEVTHDTGVKKPLQAVGHLRQVPADPGSPKQNKPDTHPNDCFDMFHQNSWTLTSILCSVPAFRPKPGTSSESGFPSIPERSDRAMC